MAKFTAGTPLNLQYAGHRIIGPAGYTHRLPDSLRQSFQDDYGDRIKGLTWVVQDEISSAGGGSSGPHPDLATHEALGLAALIHTHAESQVTNLVSDLAGKAASVHTHAQSSVTNLVSDLSGKAATVHTHAQSSVTNLVSDLAGKAASSHSHVDGDLPASIARDTEVTAAIASHEATATHGGQGGFQFPVGSIFMAVVSTNPDTLLGYGTWEAFGAGRVVMGFDSSQAGFDTAEETGGAATHGHTVTQPDAHTQVINHTHPITDPGHFHDEFRNSATTGGLDGWAAGDTSTNTPLMTGYDTGSKVTGISVNNPAGGVASIAHTGTAVADGSSLPPYIVAYLWKRTA